MQRKKAKRQCCLVPNLSKRHILKWHDAVCQLACRYADAVNVRLGIITTQVLHHTTVEYR